MGPDEQHIRLAKAVSRLTGWIYTLCWSASFYPQPILNWKRKSTWGLAIDFPAINVLGFVCYTVSTWAFLYSPVVRQQYADRHSASPEPTVRINDLAFAFHAILMSSLYLSQFWSRIWGFRGDQLERLSRPITGILCGSLLAIALVVGLVLFGGADSGSDWGSWAWIDVIYTFGYVKLLVTLVKYMPQVWMNYQRQSTDGWSIGQILLDMSGGVFSLLQLFIDASLQADWSGLTGNPIKLALGNTSIFFDVIFMIQHYFLYRGAKPSKAEDSVPKDQEPLLPS